MWRRKEGFSDNPAGRETRKERHSWALPREEIMAATGQVIEKERKKGGGLIEIEIKELGSQKGSCTFPNIKRKDNACTLIPSVFFCCSTHTG